MTTPLAVSTRSVSTFFLALAASLFLVLPSATASAAPPVSKDGKIHACYKAKGKGKGTLRLVGSGKARCPRKWKKISWQATPSSGPRGAAGPAGPTGPAGSVAIERLESRVSTLQTKLASLEDILKGVDNQELLGAISLSPVVQALCTQAGTVTGRLNVLEGVLGGLNLNGVLTTLGGLLNVPALPGALPAFSCPTP